MSQTGRFWKAPKLRRVFYGWWIVAAGIGMAMINGALYVYGFSAYFRPLVTEFGWTRTALSGVISLSRLEGGIIGPITGFFIDRFGPRPMMLIGVAIMGLGFVLLSRIQDFLGLAMVYILVLSVGSSFGTVAPVQASLVNWFIKKRGFVLGLLFAGFGLGGFLIPLVAWVIEHHGWRSAALASAMVMWVVGFPIALVMRHRPEQYGYLPDGDPLPGPSRVDDTPLSPHPAPGAQPEVDFTPMEAVRTRAFWLMAFAWLLWSMLPAITTVHLIPFFIDIGFHPQLAATVFGIYTLTSGICRPFVGWVGDRVSKRYLLACLWVVQVLGLFLLTNVHTIWDVVPFILVFAPSYGGIIPLRGAFQGEYFGRKHFATISGIIRVVDLLGTVAGPVAVGWAFDNAGGVEGYRLAFRIVGIVNLAGALAILAAVRPTLKRAQRSAPDAQTTGAGPDEK